MDKLVVDYDKHIKEGWTVGAFIEDLAPSLNIIMTKQSHIEPFKTRVELKKWCMENQLYYKKYVPDVVNHFVKLYKITN